MDINELTPAQKRLISFCGRMSSLEVYEGISNTLAVAIGNYATDEDGDDSAPEHNIPTIQTLRSWTTSIELLKILHEISVEHQLAAERPPHAAATEPSK